MLRDYQIKQIKDLEAAARRHKRVLLQAPTGSGKSVVFSEIIRRAVDKAADVLFLVHRRELIWQAEKHLAKVGVNAGIIMAGVEPSSSPVQLASVQTLGRRLDRMDVSKYGLVVIDECFPAGTQVDGEPIETVKAGDWVRAFDPVTKLMGFRRVVRTRVSKPSGLMRFRIGDDTLICTPNHKIMTKVGWIRAELLRRNAMVFCLTQGWLSFENEVERKDSERFRRKAMEGRDQPFFKGGWSLDDARVPFWSRVDRVEILKQTSDGTFGGLCPGGVVYNLEVKDFHTYFANGIGVANCHHHGAKTYTEIVKRVNGSHVLGWTATPIRKGGQLLGDIFDVLVAGPRVTELQAQGYLSETEYMSASFPDLRGIGITGGDYSEKALQEKAVPVLVGGVVDHYLQYAGKKGIVFSCGQKHSFYLREDFARHGRKAIVIDSRTPDDERKELEREFRSSDAGILINCGIFTEGYDLPDCDTLVLARPTKSLCLYLQMAGRGLRPAPGKTLLIIDHGANVYRHGFVEDEREWSLTQATGKDRVQEDQSARVRKYAACPGCGTMLTGPKCHTCGHEVTRFERARNVEELKNCGLKLVDRGSGKRSAMAATPAAWKSIIGLCALKDWSMGAAVHRFKARYGVPPWEAKLEVRLPRGDEWKMKAKDWFERV